MAYMQTKVLSHSQKVCRLYKEALTQLRSYYQFREVFRYEAVLMRDRFDRNKNEKNLIKAKQMLIEGQRELFIYRHPQPFKFANSPGGVAYGREARMPDWSYDIWHPLERLQYPVYFARREKRKQEYIDKWYAKYGKPDEAEH